MKFALNSIKRLIKSSFRTFENQIWKFRYCEIDDQKLTWDGSKFGFLKLCEYLLLNIINLSNNKKTFLVQPPIFQRSIHRRKIEKIEVFSRSFIGAAYYLTALESNTRTPTSDKIRDYYTKGIVQSFDPDNKSYWGFTHHLMVENSSIIVGLLIQENGIWSNYTDFEKKIILEYLQKYTKIEVFENNWLWFKLLHLLFIDLNSEKSYFTEIEDLLCRLSKMLHANGWFRDGNESFGANIDYYNAWAFHYYFQIIRKYGGKQYQKLFSNFDTASNSFSKTYQDFFIPGGSHPIFGRSQLYKFGTLAPFYFFIEQCRYTVKELRYLKSGIISEVNTFLANGGISKSGFLTMGVGRPSGDDLESYSGSGSPYWAMKAFSLLMLRDDDLFWSTQISEVEAVDKVVTITENKKILSHSRRGRILLLDAINTSEKYGDKYNKFIYNNVLVKEKQQVYNWKEHSLKAFRWNRSLNKVRILNSLCKDGSCSVNWTFDECDDLQINSYFELYPNSYNFIHKFSCNSNKKYKFQIFGCTKCNDYKSLGVVSTNIKKIQFACENGVDIIEFEIQDGSFIEGFCAENVPLSEI